jgi:SanA protein
MKQKILWILALIFLCGLLASFPFLWQGWIELRYASRIVAPEAAPSTRVAIVFGARVYSGDRLSAMLRDRVDTAVDLYRAGKVDTLLMSGGTYLDDYDEPGAMMAYAAQQGVPLEDMQADYGGRRTYDSCYRARNVFLVHEAILVTQNFHLPRALFTCDGLGMTVHGVSADRRVYSPRSIAWSESREIPALLAALVDVALRLPPPAMNEPIPLD